MRTIALLVIGPISMGALAACYGSSADEPPPDRSTAGKTLASALGCGGCHGADLSGSRGPNLTPDVATGLGAWSDGQIIAAIRSGVDDEGAKLCSSMPRFAALDDDQAGDLVAFLRSLQAASHDVATIPCGDGDGLSDAGLDDGGVVIITDDGDAAASTCTGFADPSTPAACHACSAAPCQANGCFGGYYCDLSVTRCVPKPAGCE